MYNLGNLLKELRLENKLTQEELANKLNNLHNIKLNKGMISKWEANKSEPRFEYIKYLSKLYNVSLDYLLGLTNYKNENEININKEQLARSNFLRNPLGADSKLHSLLKSYNKLNELGKEESIKRIEELTYITKYTTENNKLDNNSDTSIFKDELCATISPTQNDTLIENPKEEKRERLQDYFTTIAAHNDDLTEEEKIIAEQKVIEALKKAKLI